MLQPELYIEQNFQGLFTHQGQFDAYLKMEYPQANIKLLSKIYMTDEA